MSIQGGVASARVSRTAPIARSIWLAWLLGASVLSGLVIVLASSASPTWIVLILAAGAAAAALTWSGHPRTFLLHGYLFTLPIYLTKTLIARTGVYAPQLAISLADLFLLPLIGLWLWDHWFVSRRPIHRPTGFRVTLFHTGWIWVSAFMAVQRSGGVSAAVTFTKYWLVYLILADLLDTPARLRGALIVIGAGVVPNLLFTAAQFVTHQPLMIQGAKYTTLGTNIVFSNAGGVTAFRPSALLGHPNVLGAYATILLPTLVALVLVGRRSTGLRTAWVAGGLALAAGFMLVVSLSRGGWIATGCALLFLMSVGWRRGLVSGRHVATVALAGAFGLAAVVAIYPAALLRITESDARSGESRLVMIDQALLIIRRHPTVGVGLGGYNGAAQVNIPHSFATISTAFQDKIKEGVVHNKFLLVFAEQGAIGLVLFLAVYAVFLRAYLRQKEWRDRANGALALGLAAAIVAQLVAYLFDHFYADVRVESIWVVFGLLAASLRLQTAAAAERGRTPMARAA